jgi:hypothetical protein
MRITATVLLKESVEEMRNVYKILVIKREDRRLLERPMSSGG